MRTHTHMYAEYMRIHAKYMQIHAHANTCEYMAPSPMYRRVDTWGSCIVPAIHGAMYRRTDTRTHVSPGRYMTDTWGFLFLCIGLFLRVFGWPLRYAPIHDSARIHAKYSKIQQNTFGGIHTLYLGGIAPKPLNATAATILVAAAAFGGAHAEGVPALPLHLQVTSLFAPAGSTHGT